MHLMREQRLQEREEERTHHWSEMEATAKEREARLADKEAATGYGRPPSLQDVAKEVYGDLSWTGKPPDQVKAEIQRRYQERIQMYQDMVRGRGQPATPAAPTQTPPEPGARQGPDGRWYRRGPNGEAVPIEAVPTS